ncbi:MAG: EAL domain-containing protein [Lysobacter sp.]|nr:EAL domain-containing protein [Lysobacter sp.]
MRRRFALPQDADAHQVLAALRAASDDPDLPPSLRALLEQACNAQQAATTDAESARQRYHALFDAVPDPVMILGIDGMILDVNKAAIVAFQRARDALVGMPVGQLGQDLPKEHMARVVEALAGGGSHVTELSYRRADGTHFPAEVHAAAFEHHGRPAVLAVARDLSGRAEAELRYRELMEMIDKGIIVRDADGQITHINPAAMRILGIEDEQAMENDLRGEVWVTFDEHGREVPKDEQPATYALRTSRIVESTVLGFYSRRTRQLRWLSVTCVPQFEPGGSKPARVLSLFSDVTALKRDSALFDRVQALAHIGGWEWDAGRDRLHLSDEAVRILGRSAAPTSLEQVEACLVENDRRQLQLAMERVLAEGGDFDLELQGRREDGHAFWARFIGEVRRGEPLSQRLTGTLQDITERKQAEETLRVQARTDPLTNLLNRDAILGELDARLADPVLSHVAVLYIDLDRFKLVNDVLGHAAGDELLATAARRIVDAVGTEGLIARFGGDEFLVVCSVADDASTPERVAERILAAFTDSFCFGSEEFSVTASIGIARAPEDGDRPQALIQNADAAMYESKRRSRNGWQAFNPALALSQQERLRMETQLRRAADNNEFHLVYQPQVDLRRGAIVGAEALIRWNSQQLGEMRPDHFIGHAETTGDIVRIGGWVLREACRQVCAWRDAGLGIVRIAVNVSYRQFLGDDLADVVQRVLDDSGLPGSAIELEFTERVLIEDAPDTLRTFARLREMGVVLTIDDFGEGYSALNYLRRLPIHGLKLSQHFLQGVPGNKSDVAVCQAVAGIARSLGLGLVAEGIESEAQRRFLLELGVPVGQGFLFAPGLAPDDFALRLERTHL